VVVALAGSKAKIDREISANYVKSGFARFRLEPHSKNCLLSGFRSN